ncbi:mannose-6-phosphate isomerase-like protein (cupin superfamily) [Naumannella cuiyingiana]|uniref:Mannose-6-phosphate isomerase-like protein (Cupin superfamily) n=1 Tax=Naumannella cuiyingiana TaxID=1347891 RepID=A0A7Z0IJT6_9ACTN|nr:cupin domain-containing protein [Naumannella cuiyingiana]NYI69843.1 mannose-6-phosphate isomerase-like protein (cupin superfamily) [Naumannella cuiyingiana]
MSIQPRSLDEIFSAIERPFSPVLAASINDYDIKAVRVQGDFVWHAHADTDELFWVSGGELLIDLREDGAERTITLGPGAIATVPAGIEHRTRSAEGADVVMIEPAGTLNTGDATDLPDGIRPTTAR